MDDLLREIGDIVHREGATRVRCLRVTLGVLANMTPEHFREHLEAAAPGTPAEGAEIECDCDPDPRAPGAQGIRLRSLELEYPG
jgi:Zn finger protein HypA/HybF involved in hydrogenase expression